MILLPAKDLYFYPKLCCRCNIGKIQVESLFEVTINYYAMQIVTSWILLPSLFEFPSPKDNVHQLDWFERFYSLSFNLGLYRHYIFTYCNAGRIPKKFYLFWNNNIHLFTTRSTNGWFHVKFLIPFFNIQYSSWYREEYPFERQFRQKPNLNWC